MLNRLKKVFESFQKHEVKYLVIGGIAAALAESGLFKLLVTEEYGNSTKMPSLVSICLVREQLARCCPNAELIFVMHGLGSYPIIIAGNKEQIAKYCPLIATGEKIFTFALTEP